ncbi:MAG: acyltransferase family protein [Acidimicrobiales bacterium]
MSEVTAVEGAEVEAPADERAPLEPEGPPALEIAPGQEAPTPPRPPRFSGFDGLRAIAAGTVVGVHVGFVSGLTLRNASVGIYTSRLEIGVAVFFLISGFLLYRPFVVAHLGAERHPNTGAFWMRRLLRIVPAYWVALFVTTTILHANPYGMGPGGWHAYALHYLFAQIYVPAQAFGGITQAWTLCVEMSFYLVLPLYAMYVGRRSAGRTPNGRLAREVGALAVLIAISLAWRFWVLSNQHGHGAIFSAMTVWLPAELDLFALGMLLAVLSARAHLRDAEPRWMSKRWFPWASWALAGVAFWGVSHLGLPRDVIYTKSLVDITRQTLYGVFAFFLLLPAIFGPQDRGLLRRFLRSWPMASLGAISYSLYLWHQTLLNELVKYYPRWFGMKVFFDVAFWGMFGEVFGAAIVVAAISYLVVEKPALRAKRFFAWFTAPPVPVPSPMPVPPANDPVPLDLGPAQVVLPAEPGV